MYNELVQRLREHNGWALNETLDQAADAIEELSAIREEQKAQIILMGAEIEELKTYSELYQSLTDKSQKTARNLLDAYPKWIPVTERLPESEDEVVVAFKNSEDGEWWYRIDNFVDGEFCYNKNFNRNIEYWMPLPEPPKEE